MTFGQIFFKLKFSKFIQNFRTLNVFGKFLLIVYGTVVSCFVGQLNELLHHGQAKSRDPTTFLLKGWYKILTQFFNDFKLHTYHWKVWMPLLYLCLHGRFNEVTSLLFLFVSGRVVFQIWGATTAKWKDFSWQDVHFFTLNQYKVCTYRCSKTSI